MELKVTRCIIIPSIAASIFADITTIKLTITRVSFEEFISRVKRCDIIINYNRHPPTNQLLSRYISFNSGVEYRLDRSDMIFVVGLKARTPISGQDVPVTANDLLILQVEVE
jgi:hypothetical protein